MWQRNDGQLSTGEGAATAEPKQSALASQAGGDELDDASSTSSDTDVETAAKPPKKSR